MKKALITGITGQDGAYLSRLLLDKGYAVAGTTRSASPGNVKNLAYLSTAGNVTLIETNLLDLSSIIRIMERHEPTEIYNLAAQSSVGLSFEQPIGTLEFNIISTANLLEAVRIVNPAIRFYQASSSEMFGQVGKRDLPVHERSIIHPVSPYAISKATCHWTTINYREAYGMFACCGILFNHESALRGKSFVTKKILTTGVRIARGLEKGITLGNLDVWRDWGYTPDYIVAMWLMLQQEAPRDYIVCSGEAHSLQEFASEVFTTLGLDLGSFLRIDRDLYRPVEMEIMYGDNSRARNQLGWSYTRSFRDLIKTLIEDEQRHMAWESAPAPLREGQGCG